MFNAFIEVSVMISGGVTVRATLNPNQPDATSNASVLLSYRINERQQNFTIVILAVIHTFPKKFFCYRFDLS